MHVIASYNIKGGVGKTAAAVNLAYLAAHQGWRTLVWDLDPQGAASFYFRVKPKVKKGARGLIEKRRDLDEVVKSSDYDNLDLIPADFSYRNMDLLLEDTKNPERRLRKLLKPLNDDYDFVFLDCPPSISLVSESVFYAADVLLIPVIPTVLSQRTLEQLRDFHRQQGITGVRLFPYFSMVDRRKALHRDMVEHPPFDTTNLLNTVIPYASEVEKMGLQRAPLHTFAGRSPAGQAFSRLWDELLIRLSVNEPATQSS